jgi:predicted MPP superfamily phosphohydrolase
MPNQTLTWIHLSDLHMQSKDSFNRDTVLEALWADIKALQKKGLQPDFVAFTGDIAYHAKPDEYELAKQFFDELLVVAGIGKDRLYLVPGNHDADWGTTALLRNPIPGVQTEDDILQLLQNQDSRETLLQPFSAYRRFVGSYLPAFPESEHSAFAYSRQFEKGGRRISVVGLNSAWLSGFHRNAGGEVDDRGRLAIGEFQAHMFLPADAQVTIALMHHPVDWLMELDKDVVESFLTQSCSVILRGHLHRSNLLSYQDLAGSLVIIPAGAVFVRRQHPNMYNVVQVDLNTRKGTVYFRRYIDQQRSWQKDIESTGEDKDGQAAFEMRGAILAPRRRTKLSSLPEVPSPQNLPADLEQRGDISELVIMAKAFPLAGKTRIIYTCRSRIEKKPFECPSEEDKLGDALVAASHIPVDEFETSALCFAWYGREILGTAESQVRDSVICSDQAIHLPGLDDLEISTGKDMDQALLDNIVVVGENAFSNRLYQFICHQLPWRHVITEVTERPSPLEKKAHPAIRRFRTRAVFSDHLGNAIDTNDALHLTETRFGFGWAVVTFVRNPFALDKWILFLLGCHRLGQYMLLSWLRDPSAYRTLSQVAEYRQENAGDFLQIVIKGQPKGEATRGQIQREWRTIEAVKDVSAPQALPFFTAPLPQPSQDSKWGDQICDLSLLATIPGECDPVRSIQETIPDVLQDLVGRESQNGGAGLHVTLYEFLHKNGWDDLGFAQMLIDAQGEFGRELKAAFLNLPAFRLRVRQSRLTRYSLQVLVDIQCDIDEYFARMEHADENILTAMDLVIRNCRMAQGRLPEEQRNRFNVDRAPMPLHLTLLRFGPHATDQQRDAAKEWASTYSRRVWGYIDNLTIVLARASRSPFHDVAVLTVR